MSTAKSHPYQYYCDSRMEQCELVDTVPGLVTVFSSRHPYKETANEDSALVFAVDENRIVLAVADGVGGLPAGASASKIALESLLISIEQAVKEDLGLRYGILNGFELANSTILESNLKSATTLTVVEIENQTLRCYHVGDSTALVTGLRGKLKMHTVAHSPTGYAVEAGLMDEDEAMQHDERNLILNCVGATDMRIEIGPRMNLGQNDTVLIASDGLFDNVATLEAVDGIRSGNLVKKTNTLSELAQGRMVGTGEGAHSKPDDLTLVAFRFHAPKKSKKHASNQPK